MIPQIFILAALTAPRPITETPSVSNVPTLAALHALQDDSLGAMRAGSPVVERPFGDTERETLNKLDQSDSNDLSALRAGAMSDRDWQIVALIAVGVLVLVVLL